MSILALDLGGTLSKCFRITNKGACEVRSCATLPNISADPLAYELDAEEYYQQVLDLLSSWTDDAEALLVSTQMHGYVLTDHAFNPLSPYVSWRDRYSMRAGKNGIVLDELRKRLSAIDITSLGVPIKSNIALSSLYARRELLPEAAQLNSLGGYLIGRLTGTWQCHITNAAPLGLLNVKQYVWRSDILQMAGLSNISLPALTAELKPVGEWKGIEVYPDLGDQQVCALGAGLEAGILHVNIGTAGLIGCLATDFTSGDYENRPWLDRGYLRTISGLPGGRHLEALVRVLEVKVGRKVWNEMVNASGNVPGGLPVWDFEHPEEMLSHLSFLTPELAARWFYRDLAESYRRAAGQLKVPLRGVAFSGGCVLKNPALRRAIQDALGVSDAHCRSGDVSDGLRRLSQKIA